MKHFYIIMLSFTSLLCYSQSSQSISFTINSGIENGSIKQTIQANTTSLLVRINESYNRNDSVPVFNSNIITTKGLEAVKDLWKYGHFYCYTNKISENLVRLSDDFQVRNIPVIIEGKDTSEVVVGYLPDGRINDFHIGLKKNQYASVLNGNTIIDETRRQIILNFIENFRNYYIKKDINNIEKLYSEKALIIIGKVLKPIDTPLDQIQTNFTQAQVNLIVLSKQEYINRLRTVFRNTSYLLVDFDSIQVVKHRKYPNFYGALLLQSWKASNYNDKGWLFLLVQFKDNEEPLIWVRTWQDVLNTPLDSVFGMHNFIIKPGPGKPSD